MSIVYEYMHMAPNHIS